MLTFWVEIFFANSLYLPKNKVVSWFPYNGIWPKSSSIGQNHFDVAKSCHLQTCGRREMKFLVFFDQLNSWMQDPKYKHKYLDSCNDVMFLIWLNTGEQEEVERDKHLEAQDHRYSGLKVRHRCATTKCCQARLP